MNTLPAVENQVKKKEDETAFSWIQPLYILRGIGSFELRHLQETDTAIWHFYSILATTAPGGSRSFRFDEAPSYLKAPLPGLHLPP